MNQVNQERAFTVLGIHHVGMVAKDTVKAGDFLEQVLGLELVACEHVKEQKTRVQMFDVPESKQTHLELIQDDGTQGPVFKFLNTRGAGLHHLAVQVSDLTAALQYCRAHGVRLVDESPRQGAQGTQVAFVHPAATGGILIELVEHGCHGSSPVGTGGDGESGKDDEGDE